MKARIIVTILVLAALVGAGLYFRGDLVWFYLHLTEKISEIEKNSLDFVNQVQKEISAPPPLSIERQTPLGNLTKAGTIKWTNIERVNNGQKALAENSILDKAALTKAQDILKNQYFEHISPSGVGPAELAKNVGYDYLAIGENLARGNFKDDQDLVEAWMNSPGHRANILNARYQEIGVAVVKGTYEGHETWVAVQEFGLPVSSCPSLDQTLKQSIDANEKQLSAMEGTMASLRQQIESTPMKREDYISAVSQYNDLVQQYNDLAAKSQTMAAAYNRQVDAYNKCAGAAE